MLPLLLGAGAGLLKSELVDKPRANKERELAARTAELSPWTGMSPTMPEEANPMGSMLQGGLAGAQLGQGLQAANQQEEMLKMFQQQQLQNQAPPSYSPKMGGNVGSPWSGMIA